MGKLHCIDGFGGLHVVDVYRKIRSAGCATTAAAVANATDSIASNEDSTSDHFAVWDRIDEILDRIKELGGGGISRHLHPQRLVQWV